MSSEIQSVVDPRTNETVKRINIPDFLKTDIEKALNDHQNNLNQFMGLSQQYADIQDKWMEKKKDITATDAKLKERMQFACKKLKLDKNDPWTYHMVEKVFELREPGPIQPLTSSQVEESLAEEKV
jgi:hypothetical protein